MHGMDTMEAEYITEQVVKSWEVGGSAQLHQLVMTIVTNESDDAAEKLDRLRTFALEIFYAGVRGILALSSIATFVANIYSESTKRNKPVDAELALGYAGPESVDDPLALPSLITDLLWLLDQSTDPKVQSGMETERGRVVELAKELMTRDFIPETLLRERLELEFQQLIGLVYDAQKVEKNEVRTRTTMLYAQTKYNLLREESEGYAKLITELFGSLPKQYDAHVSSSTATGGKLTPAEAKRLRAQAVDERAHSVMRNITSMIGYFRIDPNRVLDIILDLFTANIADHWDFFLRLLEISPWAPRQDQDGQKALSKCGQVLGFKFDWYNKKSTGRNVPENLVYVAAVLIKHGLVQLGDLYPHLTPADEDIPTVYKDYLDGLRKAEKTAGRFQVQELVGTLGDDGKTSTAATTQVKEEKVEAKKTTKVNQKAELVAALIVIGHVKTAFTMIERQPRLVDLQPEISENLCRWLRELTGPWDVKPLANAVRIPRPSVYDFRAPLNTIFVRLTGGQGGDRVLVGRNKHPPRLRFFYEDWKSEMPVIRNAFEFVQRLRMYLAYLGPYLYRDPILVGQLIRMGALHVTVADQRLKGQATTQAIPTPENLATQDAMDSVPYEKIITGWLNIVANYFLPAISQSDPNPANSQGLWKIIKIFPYEKRYALYGEWKNRLYSDTPEMRVAKAGCERDCRYIMSRLSKDSGKQSGRQIGKVVHSNPVVAFAYIIKQLESYDNMIPHVVDASRYLTELEFDILPYCLIGALAEPKTRTESNGMSIAPWLKSLATFTGQVFKKHPMELTPLLRYLVNQLTVGNVHDLIVLHELVGSMSGIKLMEEATEAQLEALGGGETLKREAFIWENIRTMRRSGLRLMKALVDTGYSSQMAILISQRKQEIIYQGMNTEDDNMDVKILAWLNDYCQRTLLQYVEFLTCTAPPEVYAKCMPDVGELMTSYGLDPEAAFFLARVKLAREVKMKPLIEEPVLISTPINSTAEPLEEGESTEDKMDVDGGATVTENGQGEQQPMEVDNSGSESVSPSGNVWIPGLQPTIQSVAPLLPSTVWSGISSPFYVTFWQLSLYDIFVPKTRYHAEISTQKKHIRTFETEIAQLERERDHASVEEARKKRKDIDRANVAIKTLEAEWRIHEDHHKGVMKRLKRESGAWFETSANRSDIINTMIQYCLQPRCVQSPADAMYCARFIMIMHSLGTPSIPTATLYDRMCSRDIIHACIFAATEDEAKNYGTFLALIFQTLSSWHKNAALFQKEAIGSPPLPGFLKKWPTGVISGKMDLTHADFIEYEEFRQALRKWHLKLCKAVLACLSSGEYMQIRNAILVLDRVNDFFPATKQMGGTIKLAVLELEKTETRGDLKQLARSYGTKLQLREKEWQENREFCRVMERKGGTLVATPTTPVPATTTEKAVAPVPAPKPVVVVKEVTRPLTPNSEPGTLSRQESSGDVKIEEGQIKESPRPEELRPKLDRATAAKKDTIPTSSTLRATAAPFVPAAISRIRGELPDPGSARGAMSSSSSTTSSSNHHRRDRPPRREDSFTRDSTTTTERERGEIPPSNNNNGSSIPVPISHRDHNSHSSSTSHPHHQRQDPPTPQTNNHDRSLRPSNSSDNTTRNTNNRRDGDVTAPPSDPLPAGDRAPTTTTTTHRRDDKRGSRSSTTDRSKDRDRGDKKDEKRGDRSDRDRKRKDRTQEGEPPAEDHRRDHRKRDYDRDNKRRRDNVRRR